jgi:N utilization substance protein A
MNIGNSEMIQIADSVARDKGIPRQAVISAMEQAIQVASRKKYGHDNNIRVTINPQTGETKINRILDIVEEVEIPGSQISLEDAVHKNPEAKIGDEIVEPLPPIDIARVVAQSAKQVIIQKVREAERERQYEEFKDRIGDIVSGTVRRIEFGNIVIELGRGEAILRRENAIKGEIFKVNDRIRAYIEDVRHDNKGPQIILSRIHPQFLAKLFAQEVPEIYDSIIEVKSVAREPGIKSKIAVHTNDSSLDPVGSCVGVRGSRVQAVINELHGEKIDIIQWSSDHATFVINSLTPAEVTKVVIDEDNKRIEVVVPTEQLSIAIGRRGQNVRLASQLTGWNIDVMTEEEESKRRVEEFNYASKLFINSLGVEEVLAQLLAAEGFASLEDIAYTSLEELSSIEGFDEELAKELIYRAKKVVEEQNKDLLTQLDNLGVDGDLIQLVNLNLPQMRILADNGIKKMEDLAELTVEEFEQIIPNSGLSSEEIRNIINQAIATNKDTKN